MQVQTQVNQPRHQRINLSPRKKSKKKMKGSLATSYKTNRISVVIPSSTKVSIALLTDSSLEDIWTFNT